MKLYYVEYEADGLTRWCGVQAENEEVARRIMGNRGLRATKIELVETWAKGYDNVFDRRI